MNRHRGNDNDDFLEQSTSTRSKEGYFCLTCNKDISHLDPLRRGQHMNRCLDKEEVISKAVRIRADYDKTRDCPLCFEPLPPGPFRVTHYKRCAREHNVSAAEMNEMIQHNDKVAGIRKRTGIPHTRARQESTTEIERKLQSKMDKKNKIGPKNLTDEHLQTALALSLSENYFGAQFGCDDEKQTKLKQSTLPTLLQSTSTQERLNLMQERLFQFILTNENDGHSTTDKENKPETNWHLSRWWRLQATPNLEPCDYQIELLKSTFKYDGANVWTCSPEKEEESRGDGCDSADIDCEVTKKT